MKKWLFVRQTLWSLAPNIVGPSSGSAHDCLQEHRSAEKVRPKGGSGTRIESLIFTGSTSKEVYAQQKRVLHSSQVVDLHKTEKQWKKNSIINLTIFIYKTNWFIVCNRFHHTRFIENTDKLQGSSVRILSAVWVQIFKKIVTTKYKNPQNCHFDKTFINSTAVYQILCCLFKQLDCSPMCNNGRAGQMLQ